ncbi:MAG: carboxypeptidase regulatory-like domain-containing protein, partial [Acidobacteriota bacterium]
MRFETASEFVRLEIRPDADRKREILLPVRSVRIDVPALNLYRLGAAEAQKRSAVRVLDRERQPLADTLLFETSHHYLFANGRPAWHGSPRRLMTDTEGGLQISRASQRLLGGSPFPNGAVAVTVQDAVTPGVERLHVSVSDADGQPVPGALVLWNLGAPACGRTDEVGEIDVGVVPAARLTALTEDGRWGQIEVPARPQRALEIRVERHSVEALPTGHLVGPRNSVDSQRLLSFARSRAGLFSIVTFPEGREARGVSLASFLEGGEALTLESKTRIWTLDATVVTTDAQGRSRPVKDAVAMSTYRGWSYSGDDGTLRFDNLKGNSPLAIQAPGFAPVLIDVAPQSDPLRIEMRPGGTGFGTVTDLQGQPVEGALVALHVIEGARPKDLSTTTDAAGNFELGGLARGLSTLKVEARGFAPATVRGIETTDDGDFEIGIVALQPGAELRGVVLDEQGDPLSGVAVHFATSPGLRRLDASYTIYTRRSGGRPLAFHDPKLQTDAKGRFVLQDLLPQETLRLDLTKRGYLPLGVPIELPVEDEVELRLESAATLIGTVTFGNGDPAEGVTIVLQREDGPGAQTGPRGSKTVSTNPAGSYEFPSLAAGTYRLTARALGLAIDIPEEPFSLVAGRTKQVDLTIGDGAAVSGKVYYSDGEPAARVRVRLAGQVGVTGNDGTYKLDGVRTGLQTFRVATWLDVRTEFDVEVLPGTNVIDAEVGGFALTGQVLHADGQGAAGARVNARGAGTIADENGEFRIQGAASGRVPVLASLGDQRASVEVVVPEEANSIVLTLEDHSVGAVQGTILGLDTDEMAQVELAAIGDGFHRGPQPDFEGNFRFKRL